MQLAQRAMNGASTCWLLALSSLVAILLTTSNVSIRERALKRRRSLFARLDPRTTVERVPHNRPEYDRQAGDAVVSCTATNGVEHKIDFGANPGSINRQRRLLAASSAECYDRLLPHFVRNFRRRLDGTKRHLILHVPKTGGTTLCHLAKDSGFEVLTDGRGVNCWDERRFYPLWIWGEFWDRPSFDNGGRSGVAASFCESFDSELPQLVMNENYLDHPLCTRERIYSILVRDPVERTMSHERHLLAKRDRMSQRDFEGRLSLARNSYVTWSLSHGLVGRGTGEVNAVPSREHLEVAKDALLNFDFVMDMTSGAVCTSQSLKLMGLGADPLGRHNANKGGDFAAPLDRDQYESLNVLDAELYEFAKKLMQIDCDLVLKLLLGD